jgi:hypothetical protein
MATTYTFTIEFDDGRPSKEVSVTQGKVKLKVLKLIDRAQKSNDWADLIDAMAAMLKVAPDEAEEVELGQWQEMARVMQEAATVPNASAPPTE